MTKACLLSIAQDQISLRWHFNAFSKPVVAPALLTQERGTLLQEERQLQIMAGKNHFLVTTFVDVALLTDQISDLVDFWEVDKIKSMSEYTKDFSLAI